MRHLVKNRQTQMAKLNSMLSWLCRNRLRRRDTGVKKGKSMFFGAELNIRNDDIARCSKHSIFEEFIQNLENKADSTNAFN